MTLRNHTNRSSSPPIKDTSKQYEMGSTSGCLGSIGLLCIVAAIVITATTWVLPALETPILIAITIVLCLYPFYTLYRSQNVFSPIYFMSLGMLIVYPVRLIFILYWPDAVSSRLISVGSEDPLFRTGLILVILALAAYYTVYFRLPKSLFRWTRIRLGPMRDDWWKASLAIYCIGWVGRLALVATGRLSTYAESNVDLSSSVATGLYFLSDASRLAYALMWAYYFQGNARRAQRLPILLLITSVEGIYTAVSTASKFYLLTLFLIPVITHYLITRKLNKLALIVVILGTVFVIFPYIVQFRQLGLDYGFGNSDVLNLQRNSRIAEDSLRRAYDQSSDKFIEATLGNLSDRGDGIDILVSVISAVPSRVDFAYFDDIWLAPTVFIPRELWRDKPVSTSQYKLNQQIVGFYGGASSPWPVAEGYLQLGWIGVAITLGLMALLHRGLTDILLDPNPSHPVAVAFYAYFVIQFTFISTFILGLFRSLPLQLALWIPIFLILRYFVKSD